MADEHRIIIERDGEEYTVRVDPVPIGAYDFTARYSRYSAARGFAGGVRMSRGWPVDDRSGEGGNA